MSDVEVNLNSHQKATRSQCKVDIESTLLVIFGPLAALEVWARKRKPAVMISSNEMTTLCRLAMLNSINRKDTGYSLRERRDQWEIGPEA